MKRLLGLIIYKEDENSRALQNSNLDSSLQSVASASEYRIKDTSLKTQAVDLSEERQASFDLEASF